MVGGGPQKQVAPWRPSMTPGSPYPDADFERWYRDEHPRVVTALALAGGDIETAREATDEAFVRAYERWQKVHAMQSPGGWLYRVALNELKRRLRRQTLERELLRRERPQVIAEVPPIADPNMWHAVRGLPRRQRAAIALRYVLDLTEREVAETMGISRGAASATLTAARRNLQDLLGDELVDSEGSAHQPSGLQQPAPSKRHHPVESGAVDG